MKKADLDWKNLEFGYCTTDYNIRYVWRDGEWSEGTLTQDEQIPLHIAATCLHYGQACFEGLKVFEQKNGDVVAFRVQSICGSIHQQHTLTAAPIEWEPGA